MPYSIRISGIYVVTTWSGHQYVGSSRNIFSRWSQHRSALKRGTHHSRRLQNAWDKHHKLAFTILDKCDSTRLNEREQYWIDFLHPVLNTTPFVNNVWTSKSTREKFYTIHTSASWREARSLIASRKNRRWVPVECSTGKKYECMAHAAKEYGVSTSYIRYISTTQGYCRLGVRFKRLTDNWREPYDPHRLAVLTRKLRGTDRWTEDMKNRQSARKKAQNYRPSRKTIDASVEASRRPVEGTPKGGGAALFFPSQREAAFSVTGRKKRSSLICLCCEGKKKSAYGYRWKYAAESASATLATGVTA